MIAAGVAQCIVGLMSRGKPARADTDRRAANVYHCLRPRDAVSAAIYIYIIHYLPSEHVRSQQT